MVIESSMLGPIAVTRGVSPQDPSSTYVNGADINASPWDFQFNFQRLVVLGRNEAGEPQVAAQIVDRIVMSPHHARALHAMLGEALTAWEKAHGAIPDLRTNQGVAE
jgi:hypothetical protein